MKRTVRCNQCKLHQFAQVSGRCRRCRSNDLDVRDDLFARLDVLPTLVDVQRRLMVEALLRAKGDYVAAAAMIGISRTKLYRLMPPRDDANKQITTGAAAVPAPLAMGTVGQAGPELPDTSSQRSDGARGV